MIALSGSDSEKPIPPLWLSDSVILIAANFLAAAGNYAFQALMRRHLPWSEFGYLNSTLSLTLLAGVPLAAASQTLTHHLARINASGDHEKMIQLQAASLKLLRHLTWLLLALAILFVYPVSDFLHFPRSSLIWLGLLIIPVSLWSTLGSAWCGGLSLFRLLAILLIVTAVIRLGGGALAVTFYPWAESGLATTCLSGLVLATVVVFNRHHATSTRLRSVLFHRDLIIYGAGALSVSFGVFAFLQGDQILAQRHFSGEELGRYSGAGLLGRAIVWVGLPLLTVYFTRRSGDDPAHRSPRHLLALYLALLFMGSIFLLLFKVPLLNLLLGVHDPGLATMASHFALAILPIGLLQALGYHFLAARRFLECFLFGLCAIVYLIGLATYGLSSEQMLLSMGIGASASVGLLVVATLVRRHLHPSLAPS